MVLSYPVRIQDRRTTSGQRVRVLIVPTGREAKQNVLPQELYVAWEATLAYVDLKGQDA